MDKIQELTKLKGLLDNGIIDQKEFEKMKADILNQGVNTPSESASSNTNIASEKVSNTIEKGMLKISFGGQWFLFDAKTKLFIDDKLHSTHSTKQGFSVDIPIEKSKLNIKVTLGGMKSTTYELDELELNKQYELDLIYDNIWGKYSKKFNFSENG
jgi:hypothetical protein